MPAPTVRILFVDDDRQFLDMVRRLMCEYSSGNWSVLVAADTSEALALMARDRPDLVVIDVYMPMVDGLQFLGVLARNYPAIPKAILTGDTSGAHRAASLGLGADLFLEKPRSATGWQSIYANLNELVRLRNQEGFRGVLRKAGLQDVLQLECLARNSSVLEITAGTVQGQVFIHEGQIVHAQLGEQLGEEAFNRLMALPGGAFDLKPFAEPPQRTIHRGWEFLIMEAARKRDESAPTPESLADSLLAEGGSPTANAIPLSGAPDPGSPASAQAVAGPRPQERTDETGTRRPQIDEVLVVAPQGEVLYQWHCENAGARVDLLKSLSEKARMVAQELQLGRFDRLEAGNGQRRLVARVTPHHSLLVRGSTAPVTPAVSPGTN